MTNADWDDEAGGIHAVFERIEAGSGLALRGLEAGAELGVTAVGGDRFVGRLVEGEEDPTTLAALAHGTVRASQEDWARALQGVLGAHQRWLPEQQLSMLDQLNRIAATEAAIGRRLVQQEAILPCGPMGVTAIVSTLTHRENGFVS